MVVSHLTGIKYVSMIIHYWKNYSNLYVLPITNWNSLEIGWKNLVFSIHIIVQHVNKVWLSSTGNYMQMMHVLKPIASDVLECLTQLFDYYLYAVRIECCTYHCTLSMLCIPLDIHILCY